ncbi:ubiquitin carboxyl-terminal hydrolase 30 homolog [Agrilus planipennis]|uniref:Ubiquitin carboxyl-terminal hydrolase 30 homolog n=1 Tax=Agrilus planipennis TaxID=224129 RepID=A0A1W4WPK0_AGRPL|nr:ubiquitin carboxyl-terminal hydrolase 30 homolog [Agrilus planipennis]XP_018325847.1 ubiquitin carboxyl-terminal hydrolase 30 homolog [Agrilus planipennis]
MESDKVLVAAGLTAAAVVGAFVFWGPSTHSGSNRGRLAGLVNLGQTCFLNAILHALAACAQFVSWLEIDPAARDTSLRSTLRTVLSVVNGTHKSVQETTYAPAAVINALKRLGWVIPAGEQDAHELLNVILSTLDEEVQKSSRKSGCLSDILGGGELFGLGEPEETTTELIQSSAGPASLSSSVMSLNELSRPSSLFWRGGANHKYRWISRSCRSLNLAGLPPQPVSHPFAGTLTSQLRCTVCGYKSAVRYDKFESLSLPLPSGMGDLGWGRHKLHQLLTNFVTPEVVPDVACEGCNCDRDSSFPPILSKQIKILNFGKLPICLCIHIIRNTWQTGTMSKRQDFVQFPVRLSLAAYTFIQAQYQKKTISSMYTSTSEGGSPLSNSMPTAWGAGSLSERASEFKNVYQLQAVIVHSGNAHSGHFITYRRGYHSSKWYYTSDIEIREASIDEVLQSTAYMLFYEKTTGFSAF